jgi:hypothetical protein
MLQHLTANLEHHAGRDRRAKDGHALSGGRLLAALSLIKEKKERRGDGPGVEEFPASAGFEASKLTRNLVRFW